MTTNISGNATGKILKRANPSTIQDKFLVGYQGWFTCPGDGEPVGPGHHGWLHWFNSPLSQGGRPNVDVWPDVSSYSPSELFPVPELKSKTGEQAFLFSSRHPKTVQRHFHWMAEHGVDGAFLQRFAGQCDLEVGNEGIRKIRDEVGARVREAAEIEGRVFAIMYDVSGVPADRIQRILELDWTHLIRNQCILDSPSYLREKGKPVIGLWGFGFHNAGHTPDLIRSIIQFFRTTTPKGAYIFGGAPSCWRLSEGDADRNAGLVDVWMTEFDAISPWTIGRYKTDREADDFANTKMKGDVELIKRRNSDTGRKVDYIPVVLPGGSGFNLSEGKWGFNDIKRQGGRFLWKQIFNAKHLGVRTIYGAMWDEYDEGTAFMPVVENKRNLPQSDRFQFMALNEDGYDVPSDWYMRICGMAAESLRSERRIHETFPVKELQDYWSSRPKYEEASSTMFPGASGSSGSGGDSGKKPYQDWLDENKDDKEEMPPPPYALVAAEQTSTRPTPTEIQPPAETHSQAQPSENTSFQAQQRPQQLSDPVTGLASDFRRTNMYGPSEANPVGYIGSNNAVLPATEGKLASLSSPPLHTAHPASGRPTISHSQSQQGYQLTQTAPSFPPPIQGPPPTQGSSWSNAQWPPPEWGVKETAAPTQGGANLSRPQTFSASSQNTGGVNVEHSATISAASGSYASKPPARPNTAGGKPPSPTYAAAAGYPPLPFQTAHSPTGFPSLPSPGGYGATYTHSHPSPSSYSPGNPMFPNVPVGVSTPSYTPPSIYPGQQGASGYNPSGGPPSSPTQSYPYQTAQQYTDSSKPPPQGFPMPSGYFGNNMPPMPNIPFHSPNLGSYPGQHVPPETTPGYMGYAGGPMHSSHVMPTPWMPAVPTGPGTIPPPIPPRVLYIPSYSGPSASSSGALNYALSAVEQVAGRKTKDQLQSLANKFLK